MKKIINSLTSKIKLIILIYSAILLISASVIKTNYRGDSLYYYELSQKCIAQNEFYPARQHLFEDYIVAPLYINILIILLKIYNSTTTISLFNLLIILLQIIVLYKLSSKIFSKPTALITVLLYLLYVNTIGLMLQNYTELLFLLFLTLSIYSFLLNKTSYLILSGFSIGASIGIRPGGWALLFAILILNLFEWIKTKQLSPKYIYTYIGVIIFIIIFGGFTYLHFGKFEFTSTTGPVNLLLGANDDATGGFNSTVYEKGKAGYIEHPENLTYSQKGEFYHDTAVKWIEENPGKWISLMPLKLFHAFAWDDISLSSLIGFPVTNFAKVIKVLLSNEDLNTYLPKTTLLEKLIYFSILIISHLYYYFLLIFMVFGVYDLLKNKLNNKGTTLILLFTLFTILMIIITVGTPRYKYPAFILLLPFAAHYIQLKFGIGNTRVEKE